MTERDDSSPSAFGEASVATSTRPHHDALDTALADFYSGAESSPHQQQLRANQSTALSPLDAERQARIVQLRARLAEIEREAAATVDLVDQPKIRNVISQLAAFDEELGLQRVEAERLTADIDADETASRDLAARIDSHLHENERVANACRRRKAELNELLTQTRAWENAHAEVELWMRESDERLISATRLPALDEAALQNELRVVDEVSKKRNSRHCSRVCCL